MENIIKKLETIKKKPHWHHLCWAGSTICRVDEWGDKKIYKCPHKGKNDWGLLHHKISACKDCNGKIMGILDLTSSEYCFNCGVDEAIKLLKKEG